MNACNILDFKKLGTILFSLSIGLALGQVVTPPELILKGKVRDFIEDNAIKTPAHPHFYGNRPHQAGCSSIEANVNIVQLQIDTTNDIGDTAVFKGDNRGPKLISPLDPKVSQCFDPVDRFGDWYNDRPTGDINRSFLIDIKFKWNTATNAYEYFDDVFFPIDNGKTFQQLGANAPYGHLLPAPNDIHNYGFTMEFHAKFTYFKGKNQTFTFRGDDDVWVFINGKRAIDLGGIHPSQDGAFNLDLIAAANGLTDSLIYPLDFYFAERHTTTSKLRISTTLELEPLLSKPVVPKGDFFEGQTSIILSHPALGAVLYYTTDGSTPTINSLKYTGPILLSDNTTLKVIAVRPGYRNSDVVTEVFKKMETVATPKANPPGQIFVDPIQVTLTVATAGAVIRYTIDGAVPSATSPIYTGPLTFTVTTTLQAKAFLANWVSSAVLSETYTDASTLIPPVATPAGGTFIGSQTVILSVPGHPAATIRYTLDGTEPNATSSLYATPITFVGATTIKAKAFEKDWKTSQTMTEQYQRIAAVVKAVYIDFNGNGKIDGAIIKLDMPALGIPATVHLMDPVSKADIIFASNYVTKGATEDMLIVRFPDKEFLPGTSFPPDAYGAFANAPGFASQTFVISDSVGPVPLRAISHNKTTPEDNATIDVTFSEPLDLIGIQAGLLWPFDIIRNGAVQAGSVQVTAITALADKPNTYRWTFAVNSPIYPVYIDSLVLAINPVIHDVLGNPGIAGGKRIDVEGSKETLTNNIVILLTNPIVPGQVNIFPIVPELVRQDPFAAIGKDAVGAPTCLSCPPGTENIFLHGRPVPEWIIKSKYAFSYSFTIFDHLGNYVSKTNGQITEAMIAKIKQDPQGFRSLRFRWIPVSHNGSEVGTGAYILKGVVINHQDEPQKGTQGEDQIIRQSQSAVFATFGYLRQR
jgi:fibro-slime domain-containing protein